MLKCVGPRVSRRDARSRGGSLSKDIDSVVQNCGDVEKSLEKADCSDSLYDEACFSPSFVDGSWDCAVVDGPEEP